MHTCEHRGRRRALVATFEASGESTQSKLVARPEDSLAGCLRPGALRANAISPRVLVVTGRPTLINGGRWERAYPILIAQNESGATRHGLAKWGPVTGQDDDPARRWRPHRTAGSAVIESGQGEGRASTIRSPNLESCSATTNSRPLATMTRDAGSRRSSLNQDERVRPDCWTSGTFSNEEWMAVCRQPTVNNRRTVIRGTA